MLRCDRGASSQRHSAGTVSLPCQRTHLLLRRQQLAHAAREVELEPVLELDEAVELILGLKKAGKESGKRR